MDCYTTLGEGEVDKGKVGVVSNGEWAWDEEILDVGYEGLVSHNIIHHTSISLWRNQVYLLEFE